MPFLGRINTAYQYLRGAAQALQQANPADVLNRSLRWPSNATTKYYGTSIHDRHMSVLANESTSAMYCRRTSLSQVKELPVRAQSVRHINVLQNIQTLENNIIFRSSYELRTSKRDVMCDCGVWILKIIIENHYCYQKVSVKSYLRFIVATRYSDGIPNSHFVFSETQNW